MWELTETASSELQGALESLVGVQGSLERFVGVALVASFKEARKAFWGLMGTGSRDLQRSLWGLTGTASSKHQGSLVRVQRSLERHVGVDRATTELIESYGS